MDEMRAIADMLDATPSEQSTMRGRNRLTTEIRNPEAGNGAQATGRRRLRWPVLAGAGLVTAAAAATAAAIVVPSGGAGTGTPGGTPVAEPMTARTVLMSAAERAEAAPATGRYWHVRTLGAHPVQVGPAKNRYWMERLQIEESWTDRDGRSWSGYREIGARPFTAADNLAWKRDGQPAKWDLGVGDTADRARLTLQTKPKAGLLSKIQSSHTFNVCDKNMTFKQLQALPTDPAALRAAVTKAMNTNDDAPVPADGRQGFLQSCLTGLLVDVPVRPQTRAAAFRALAAMPGVKATGATKDDRGRPGVGLSVHAGGNGPLIRLVIDPKNSLVLSQSVEQVGKLAVLKGKSKRQSYLQVGWSDAAPAVPSLP
ncbi:CU044_5270 family protein [Actinomadura hibisca]|uniref:CU044_5270 family protein n=1 Tax=Actinomadura hibisca TaxID=68565 RepID=UPI0008353B20|nr:CU044_5270 family protein [Actinomadura hibisca]